MKWDAAIEIHRSALLRLLAGMYAALGIEAGGSVDTVRQHVRLAVLGLLGPAESAVRRLAFLKARYLPDVAYERGPAREKTAKRKGGGSHAASFPLFDPRKKPERQQKKRQTGPGPRLFFLDGTDPPYSPEPEPDAPKVQADDPVPAARLCARLNALLGALSDLDKQARRLKRALARRKLSPRLSGQGVVRINTPPGHREKGRSGDELAVDQVLRDCQWLARHWVATADTS